MRLVAPAHRFTESRSAPFTSGHACQECGLSCASTARFCDDACRKRFNNRRMRRGALLFDLFMAWRYERRLAKKLKIMPLMCRLAAHFYREDLEQRDGRPSWHPPALAKQRLPQLLAEILIKAPRPRKEAINE